MITTPKIQIIYRIEIVLILFISLISYVSSAQQLHCDTIFLNDGTKIIGQIKEQTSSKVTYIKCCEVCTVPRVIKKNAIDHIALSDQTKTKIEANEQEFLEKEQLKQSIKTQQKDSYTPLSINLEIGGKGPLACVNLEYLLNPNSGISLGTGYFSGISLNSSFFMKFGSKNQFVPSIGYMIIPNESQQHFTTFFAYQNNFGDKENFSAKSSKGYFRVGPGLIITPGDLWFPVLPWISITLGVNL